MKENQKYLYRYEHEGQFYTFTVRLDSLEDATKHLQSIRYTAIFIDTEEAFQNEVERLVNATLAPDIE